MVGLTRTPWSEHHQHVSFKTVLTGKLGSERHNGLSKAALSEPDPVVHGHSVRTLVLKGMTHRYYKSVVPLYIYI